MAWTTPLTAVANTALTAAQWNASVRDNLNETAPAKAATAGGYFVVTGTKVITQRLPQDNEEPTADTTASTAYVTSLASTNGPNLPSISAVSYVLLIVSSDIANTTANQSGRMVAAISGATSVAAADQYAMRVTVGAAGLNVRASCANLFAVNNGSNTFTANYRASGGTAQFANRRMSALPF